MQASRVHKNMLSEQECVKFEAVWNLPPFQSNTYCTCFLGLATTWPQCSLLVLSKTMFCERLSTPAVAYSQDTANVRAAVAHYVCENFCAKQKFGNFWASQVGSGKARPESETQGSAEIQLPLLLRQPVGALIEVHIEQMKFLHLCGFNVK